jgi:hypothetical protein
MRSDDYCAAFKHSHTYTNESQVQLPYPASRCDPYSREGFDLRPFDLLAYLNLAIRE